MSNDQKAVSIPRYIGQVPLTGRFYTAECMSCGWIGSSQELTDDCQCTRMVEGRYCLGDTEEIGTGRLLEIIQVIAAARDQVQREPTIYQVRMKGKSDAEWREWGECSKEVYDDLYGHPEANKFGIMREVRALFADNGSGEVERLRTEVQKLLISHEASNALAKQPQEENDTLRERLAPQGTAEQK
ncbi:hypothetical protein [Pseudomonas mosselii]|uniref:hypothetical protein n=1 Tax=Pseudomonas mosselii TaxID=78327 RepID=UPI0021D8628B|nr:hypothetical protein [Pseudomonas mosselii]MCU9527508.1 hypothetical protein [Pseudomonas mosselii]MCU9534821.1 hypothetical protein [Pseudomonas mosselii]MCU9542755.1 hypothetical protein [Pseudomonas mosselii]MCU9546661.1 hypothetical protein [Pseudomonas mosselii]